MTSANDAERNRSTGPTTTEALRGVLSLELTQRARSSRWRGLLIAWFVILVGSVLLQSVFFNSIGPGSGGDEEAWSRAAAESIATGTLLFVLLVGLLVAPALTATSINGDRRDGVLALVQAAPVPTSAVVVGKLLAAWIASLAFLLVSLPVLIWTVIRGGMPWWAMLLGVVIVALLLLAVAGMGLGLSALTPRTSSSTMLSYFVVAVLVVGLPVAFGMAMPMMQNSETRQVASMTRYDENLDLDDTTGWCREELTEVRFIDTRPISWLVLPNPVVVTADAMPYSGGAPGVASMIRNAADSAFKAPTHPPETCEELAETMRPGDDGRYRIDRDESGETAPGWKWMPGLAVNLLLGAAGVALAHRRLRVPAHDLPAGVRIA
ncbi:ABC transporter permease [uncultured Corynebacterium sp.]|uniref:ABC transporter permease n=1 Tax=uncultured Corynebacterium sp. TaxID=159447 RepID=UPI0025CB84D0|nr:ABC transporter permease subunit [uncultured Corynebacterium sp.]